jgi:hypothetical protein
VDHGCQPDLHAICATLKVKESFQPQHSLT